MNKKLIIGLFLGLFLLGNVNALSVDYFYSPNCGHCQKIAPFINGVNHKYNNIEFNFLDVTKGSYRIPGTPTAIITTNDKRTISLIGSEEIPRWLECEINEMSTLNCPTSTKLNCETNSFFIR